MTSLKAAMIAAAAVLSIGATAIYADEPADRQSGYGMGMMGGPGMMGGYGRGYGPGAGPVPGYGYGPGMMGGYGMGPGMMGGSGMGPGMMGGYGMGPGMMGGYGGMGGAALSALDLTPDQRKQVLSIQDQVRKSNWQIMGQMQDEMVKQRDALNEGKRDRPAILAANKRMFELRQQMLGNALDAADKIEKILTPQQREQLQKQWGPGWMMQSDQ